MNLSFTEEEKRDIFQWDVVNWQKALNIFVPELNSGGVALTLAEGKGGLSLMPLKAGYSLVSTDVHGVSDDAKALYSRYGYTSIEYTSADAMQLPFPDNHFDLVMFKSLLAIMRTEENQQRVFNEAHRVLKKGGKLFFCENLHGSAMHMYLRKNYVPWGVYCRYPTITELEKMNAQFSSLKFITCGVLGTLGRSEWQRRLLGNADAMVEKLVGRESHYIMHGVSTK